MMVLKTSQVFAFILLGCICLARGMTRNVYNRDGSLYCEQCQQSINPNEQFSSTSSISSSSSSSSDSKSNGNNNNNNNNNINRPLHQYIKTSSTTQQKELTQSELQHIPSQDIAPPYKTTTVVQQRVVNLAPGTAQSSSPSSSLSSAAVVNTVNSQSQSIQTKCNSGCDNTKAVDESQGCSRNPCGVNAMCQETLGGRPVCSCPPGHSGNPLTYCRRAECLDHTECRNDQSCRNGNCVNPCSGTCGINANCEVRNHVAVCSCPAGYGGDPFVSCRLSDPEELCHPSPCGVNTKCQVLNGVPTCTCLPSYTGNPLAGCRHECESDSDCGNQDFCKDYKCSSACSQCGQGAQCNQLRNHRAACECPKGFIGSPYTECRAECYGDNDCPAGRPACYYGICKNPCDGACGLRADCNLRGLTPVCSCPKDMTGDPFISCRPFTKEDLCNPNPCGTNAICTPGYDNTHKERPVCTCPPGYTGNSLHHCARGECQSDSECSDNRACINYSCVDPCLGQCGVGAICEPKRHLAVCKCPQGTSGDALVSCRQSRSYPVARYNRKRELTAEELANVSAAANVTVLDNIH